MVTIATKSAGSAPFKLGMRALVGGVTVIGANDLNGSAVGLTATAVSSLSAEPPSLLVCINRRTAIAGALAQSAAFSVNVLTSTQTDVARAFGGQLEITGTDRFGFGTWHRSPDREVPLLLGCRVAFECEVAHVHDWQTHHIVIGRVLDVHFFNPDAPPLAYADGDYQTAVPLQKTRT